MSMSAYALGAASMGNAGVDLKMPSNIRDEILTVGVQVGALDKLVAQAQAARKIPPDFVLGWTAFKGEWNAFSSSHQSWLSRTWYASYEKAVEYRRRLEDFRTKFEQLTGTKVNYPSPGANPAGVEPDGAGFPWRWVVGGGVAIGLLYGASKLLGETRELKRELVGARHHEHELEAVRP